MRLHSAKEEGFTNPSFFMADGASSSLSVAPVAPGTLERVPQRQLWDCGLACAVCVLRRAGCVGSASDAVALLEALSADVVGGSVWTIDVAAHLARRGVVSTLHTLSPGVDTAHAGLDFYAPNFSRDAERVPRVFAEARALGVRVAVGRVASADVCARLAAGLAIYIVLLDLRHMRCATCEVHTRAPAHTLAHVYSGHYVVLTGYDARAGRLLFLDPSPLAAPLGCAMDLADFDAARCSAGTDEDIIEVTTEDLRCGKRVDQGAGQG